MEEENRIQAPYYEMTYLDDYNDKHLIKLQNEEELEYFEDRFTVLSYSYEIK